MDHPVYLLYFLPFLCLLFFLYKIIDQRRYQCCYILDYQCYKPCDQRKLNTEFCGEVIKRTKNLGLHEYKFLLKAIVSSGLGEETYAPWMVIHGREDNPTYEDGILEVEEFFFDSIEKVLSKTGISPRDIVVLVLNVSMLSPSPSLVARIINHYKMRDDIKTYNLTGMGCSASLISINIVQSIFKFQKNVNALVVTSECLTPNWYLY